METSVATPEITLRASRAWFTLSYSLLLSLFFFVAVCLSLLLEEPGLWRGTLLYFMVLVAIAPLFPVRERDITLTNDSLSGPPSSNAPAWRRHALDSLLFLVVCFVGLLLVIPLLGSPRVLLLFLVADVVIRVFKTSLREFSSSAPAASNPDERIILPLDWIELAGIPEVGSFFFFGNRRIRSKDGRSITFYMGYYNPRQAKEFLDTLRERVSPNA